MFQAIMKWAVSMAQGPPRMKCKVCGAWHSGTYGDVCPDCHAKGKS